MDNIDYRLNNDGIVEALSYNNIKSKTLTIKFETYSTEDFRTERLAKYNLIGLSDRYKIANEYVFSEYLEDTIIVYVMSNDNKIYVESLDYLFHGLEVGTDIKIDITNISSYDKTNDCYFDTAKGMFFGNRELVDIEFGDFDTSELQDISSMFERCTKVEELDLRKFNTHKVYNIGSLFRECFKLKTLDLSSFDTSNVTNMEFMFERCYELETIDLSNFNTDNLYNMYSMFRSCSSLKRIDLSNFNTEKVIDMSFLFFGDCYNLEYIDCRNFLENTSFKLKADRLIGTVKPGCIIRFDKMRQGILDIEETDGIELTCIRQNRI